jgi:hypothetical protein
MRCAVVAGVLGVLVAGSAGAQSLPDPFEGADQIVCVDKDTAVDLLKVYDQDTDVGDNLLAYLATKGVCERATFSGKPTADRYEHENGEEREGHVFEVDVTKGMVLGGLGKAYMLLYVMRDNKA